MATATKRETPTTSQALTTLRRLVELSHPSGWALSKQQEVDLLEAMISLAPQRSYLADFFSGALDEFERQTKQDISCPWKERLREIERDMTSYAEDLVVMKVDHKTKKQELETLERRLSHVKRELETINKQASQLQRLTAAT